MKKLVLLFILQLLALQFLSQNCDEADLDYLSENLDQVTALATECGTGCFTSPDTDACVQQCIEENTPLSASCAGCFGEQVNCVIDNCFLICLTQPEEACANCVASNCLDAFNECAGIVDEDEDSYTTLFDCDDTNSAIYPGAPGTAEGIDNNCDGILQESEQLIIPCEGDLDGNGQITVLDLSILLVDYGCLDIDCDGNIDGSLGTTATDLSAILINFGENCN